MLSATETFRQLEAELHTREGEAHPFCDSLALQLRLAQQIEGLMASAHQHISVPESLLGQYRYTDRVRPHSSTGEVLFIEQPGGEQLAMKLLTKLDGQYQFQPHHDPTYAFHHPSVRVMTSLGESLMGKAANINAAFPMYFGVAGVSRLSSDGVELEPFSVQHVLDGRSEPAIVMRAMRTTLADVLMDTREAIDHQQPLPYPKQQLHEWTQQVIQKVIQTSVALPEDIAADIGSPEEVQNLLVGKTIGWLTSRASEPEVMAHPILAQAVEHARRTQAMFQKFFAYPESHVQLAKRAVPELDGKDSSAPRKLAQTFSPGDTKLGNVMLGENAHGREGIGLFDPQWLVLNPGVIGNEKHQFAPWPFADAMQIAAYTAAQPAAYGFPELQQDVYDAVRQYYGADHWSPWHELYLRMLTSYKLLVDVAFAIDSYLEKKAKNQDIPRALGWILTKHPKMATEVAQRALRVYDGERK